MSLSPSTESYLPLSDDPARAIESRERLVSTRTKLRGGALIVLGLGIAITLLLGLMSHAPQMLEPGRTVDGASFTGTVWQGRVAILLMATAALAGLCFAAAGVQLWSRGRLGLWLKGLSALLVATLVATAWWFSSMLG